MDARDGRHYFTRNIVDISLTREAVEPEVQGVEPTYRNKIEIANKAEESTFSVGDQVSFEGVADDLGSPIAAIEFSFDDGDTWTSCPTDGATADKWSTGALRPVSISRATTI